MRNQLLRASAAGAAQIEVGEVARRRLPDADYADAFRLVPSAAVDAEQWMRAILEGGSPHVRKMFGVLVWQGLLGFWLAAPGTANTVAGWAITETEPGLLVLTADGRLMTGRMVLEASADEVVWSTLLRYEHPAARGIWTVASHAHRAIAGPLLERTGRSSRIIHKIE